jgi:cytochrome b involved in lipid metabolism
MGVLLEHAGIDGTDDFEDVGHSSDAREIMATMKIGVIQSEETDKDCGCMWKRRLLLPVAAVAVVGLALVVYKLTRRIV